MPSRTTRVLFVVAVAAVVAFVAFELPPRRARERAERGASRLFAFDATAVDGVRLRRGSEEVVFARRDTGWEMLAPVADRAETSAIASLIQALHDAPVARNLGPDDDDERFGLLAPVEVWVSAGRDTVARLDIGRYTPDRAFVYARRPDGDIVLAPTDVHRAATLAVDAYRSHRVVVFDRATVRSFRLRNPAGASRWTRSGPTAWFSAVAGDTVAGDSTAVEAVLRTLRGLRVSRLLAPPDTAGALDHAAVVVTVESAPPSPPLTVRIRCAAGAPCRARCDGETRVSEVDGDIGVLLTAGFDNLRDRRLLRFTPQRAGRIEISTPDTSAVLVRAGDAWAVPNPALASLDRGRMAEFVHALESLRWTRVAGPEAGRRRGASKQEFALVVYARDGSVLDEWHGVVEGNPPVLKGTSRSSGLTTETDGSALDAVTATLRRLNR
jgi:Domain of unknown function (DUF4340)